jgi:hypothetical protein
LGCGGRRRHQPARHRPRTRPRHRLRLGLAIAYDSANGVLAAFSTDDLHLSWWWRTPINTSQHLVLFPDTGALLVNDHDRQTGDAVALLDVTDGSVLARVGVDSPAQFVVFPAPGTRRDAYYVSLSTIARVVFDG